MNRIIFSEKTYFPSVNMIWVTILYKYPCILYFAYFFFKHYNFKMVTLSLYLGLQKKNLQIFVMDVGESHILLYVVKSPFK